MKNSNYNSQLKSIHKKPSFLMTAAAVSLAVISLTAQAGKIISNPTTDLGVIQDGFGGWNLDNVNIILTGTNSSFSELDGSYFFDVDSDLTYKGNVADDMGTIMGEALAKDWPVGEPAGIKIVNDDFDVKEGKPTNCIMSTSYLADHYLDSADPIQVPCSGPFQSHKRYKLAMLPTTVADAVAGTGPEKGIDLVFNVEDDGITTPRDYQVFQKINNWTDGRLEGFTIQVGTGIGESFVPAADPILGVGLANLSLSVPDAVWNASQLANFSSGLFGPEDVKHGRPPGYFDPVNPAGFFINEFPNVSGTTDTLTSGATLGSDYADLPAGALLASNQFGPWLADNMLPYGIFFDDDNNPETDAELQAWYGYNPAIADFGWMRGAADNFAAFPDQEIINQGANLAFTMGEIDDLVNVGLNYVVTIGDVSNFSAFTIRITPKVDTSNTLAPGYVEQAIPNPSLEFTSQDGIVSLDPNPTFNIGDLLTARVGDNDLNTNPLVIDTVDVTIESTTGLSQTLTLEEQGEDRGVFAQSLPEEYSDVAVGAPVTVTMTYTDADDGLGGVDVPKIATTSTEIIEPAGTLQFNPVSYTVAENGGSVVVTVERIDGSAGVATVAYMTVSGAAIGGTDYVADDGILTFGGGITSQTITIAILDNAVVDGDKTFTLQLSDAQVADAGAAGEATVVITDEDVAAATPIDNVVIPADDNGGIFGLGWITAGLFVIALLGRIRRKTV